MLIWLKYFLLFVGFVAFVGGVAFSVQFTSVGQSKLRLSFAVMDTAHMLRVVVINTPTFFQVWLNLHNLSFLSLSKPLSFFNLEDSLRLKLDPEQRNKGSFMTGQRYTGSKIQKLLNLTLTVVAYKPLPQSWFNSVYKKRKGMVNICCGNNE